MTRLAASEVWYASQNTYALRSRQGVESGRQRPPTFVSTPQHDVSDVVNPATNTSAEEQKRRAATDYDAPERVGRRRRCYRTVSLWVVDELLDDGVAVGERHLRAGQLGVHAV